MQPHLPSWGLGTPERTGTVVLGDGSRNGLIFVSGTLLAKLGAYAAARAQVRDPGTEMGGLLIGPRPEANDLLIEEAIPFEIEYRFDASIGSSLAGLDSVKRAIADAENDSSKAVLGFYRIRTTGLSGFSGHYLEILDHIAEIHSSLGGLCCCFAVGPALGSEVPLRAAIRSDGGWEEIDATTLQLEAAPGQALNGNHAPLASKRPTAVAPEIPIERAPVRSNGRSPARMLPIFASIGLVILATASGLFWWNARRALAHPITHIERSGLHTGFSANPDGSAWKLTWNSDTVAAMLSTGAVLSIDDGPEHKDIELTMADLSSGTIYYIPKTGQLAFQFRVQKDDVNIAEERVRVLDKIETSRNPAERVDGRTLRPLDMAGAVGRPIPQQQELSSPPGEPVRGAPPRQFVPPNATARTVQTDPILAIGEPITNSAITAPSSTQTTTTFAVPPPPPDPAVETPPPAQSQPQAAPPATNLPAAPAQPSRYEPPRVTKQVRVNIPLGVHVDNSTLVKLQVMIDSTGKVTKITPVGSGADIRLLAAATQAARYWELYPPGSTDNPSQAK